MDTSNVSKKGRRWKVKVIEKRKWVKGLADEWVDKTVEMELIKALIPLGLKAVEEKLAKEVDEIVGLRYESIILPLSRPFFSKLKVEFC